MQKKFKKCKHFLILHVYYFYHKNILKTRVICCLAHNCWLHDMSKLYCVVSENIHNTPPPPTPTAMEGTFTLDQPHPYNFYSRGCLSYTPRHRIFCYLTWLGPPWREYFHPKCCCTVYFYAEDNCMFSVIKRGKIFLFILKQCLMFSVLSCM